MNLDRTFAPNPASVPAARRFVVQSLAHLPTALLDTVGLIVSELATNAVLYANTDFYVSVQCSDHHLRVAITDGGTGTPHLQARPGPTDQHGRGLIIVKQLADRWGVTPLDADQVGKTVWFRLDLPRPKILPSP